MTQERISAADYLARVKAADKKPRQGSARNAEGGNPYVGLACWVCGQPVLQRHPADQQTEILPGGATGEKRVRHLNAEDCKTAA